MHVEWGPLSAESLASEGSRQESWRDSSSKSCFPYRRRATLTLGEEIPVESAGFCRSVRYLRTRTSGNSCAFFSSLDNNCVVDGGHSGRSPRRANAFAHDRDGVEAGRSRRVWSARCPPSAEGEGAGVAGPVPGGRG